MVKEEEATDDVTVLIESWDGCTYIEALGETPDVPGLGAVSQASTVNTVGVCVGVSVLSCLFGFHC